MTEDLIMLVAGVILGFGASIGATKYQEFEQRRRAVNIFNTELYKIDKLILPFIKTNNELQLPSGEIIPFNGISITEIPNFKMVMQIDIFLSLNYKLRKLIYDISLDLDCAENHRKLAIPLLNQMDRANELNIYAMISHDWLISAKGKMDNLKKELK
jgi:hypothetical protein